MKADELFFYDEVSNEYTHVYYEFDGWNVDRYAYDQEEYEYTLHDSFYYEPEFDEDGAIVGGCMDAWDAYRYLDYSNDEPITKEAFYNGIML